MQKSNRLGNQIVIRVADDFYFGELPTGNLPRT